MSLTERFYCRPRDLFESLTDERRISAYTQATPCGHPTAFLLLLTAQATATMNLHEAICPLRLPQDRSDIY